MFRLSFSSLNYFVTIRRNFFYLVLTFWAVGTTLLDDLLSTWFVCLDKFADHSRRYVYEPKIFKDTIGGTVFLCREGDCYMWRPCFFSLYLFLLLLLILIDGHGFYFLLVPETVHGNGDAVHGNWEKTKESIDFFIRSFCFFCCGENKRVTWFFHSWFLFLLLWWKEMFLNPPRNHIFFY